VFDARRYIIAIDVLQFVQHTLWFYNDLLNIKWRGYKLVTLWLVKQGKMKNHKPLL